MSNLSNLVKIKESEREKIKKAVEAFLRAGGVVVPVENQLDRSGEFRPVYVSIFD